MDEPTLPEPGAATRPSTEADKAWRLDLLPLTWLTVVLAAYAFVAMAPLNVSFRELQLELPEVSQLGEVAVPVLAVTLLAGIIRYFRLRRAPRTEPDLAGSGNGGGDSS